VTIIMGELPFSIANAKIKCEGLEVGEQEFILRPKRGLAFLIRRGEEIVIGRAPEVSDSDVHLFLVGSAWGILCHQRKLLPLHCSAIELGGRAIAFTGPSGAGKSTLAAGLCKRGFLHISDDVCVLDQSSGEVRLHAMPKGIKLWGDATEALNVVRGTVVSSGPELQKYYVSVPEYEGREPFEISALYVLTRDDAEDSNVYQLRGSDRFQEILSSIYRYNWLTLMRDPAEVFEQLAEVVKALRVFRFSRPWGMSKFDEALQTLERHMRQLNNET
jgi:hypothetical protein